MGSGTLGRRGSRTGGWHRYRTRSWAGERIGTRSQDNSVDRPVNSPPRRFRIVGRYWSWIALSYHSCHRLSLDSL